MRQYILTERAHLMCPNMHFGIKAKIASGYNKEKIQETLRELEAAHPFLKSCIAREPESCKLYYCWHEELKVPVFEKETPSLWANDYSDITRYGWDVFHECLLKLVVYPSDKEFEVMFIAHHLLGDGRSILDMVCEFADCYVAMKKPVLAKENLISSVDELTKGSKLSAINKLIIGYANRRWKNEDHAIDYKAYRRFEKEFIASNPVSYIEEAWDEAKTEDVLRNCRERGVSLNDYLVADMMCREKTRRIVIAVDIRKYLSNYKTDALGNYASATVIEVCVRLEDVWNVAKSASERIKKNICDPKKLMMILACYLYMEPELIDAAAISVMGEFESKVGRFVGTFILGYKNRNGHSVTNLGNVNNPNIFEATFIPPASPANIETMGVLSINHRLRKCTAHYQ